MIIETDFLDHWRVRMLVDLLGGDEMAPLYIIRIWSHCQNRKQTQLKPMPNQGLKSLCRFAGDADLLVESLIQSGFLVRDGDDGFEVPKFREKNAQLFAAWENGKRGGRPKAKPDENPTETQPKPDANPRITLNREDEDEDEDKINSNSNSPEESLGADDDTVRTATFLFERLGVKTSNVTLWQVATLWSTGELSEAAVIDALEGVRACNARDPPSYFMRCLTKRVGKDKLTAMRKGLVVPNGGAPPGVRNGAKTCLQNAN